MSSTRLLNRWDDHPFIVIWEVTRACALACRHCRAEASPRRDPQELTTGEAERFIQQVARTKPQFFILTGGDPMMRPDIVSLISYASSQGLQVALSPSATPRFVKADLKALKAAGLHRISLSLDGATRQSHDAFRGVSGTWDWTMAAIDNANNAGVGIQLNTTFTRQNIGEFEAFASVLEEIRPAMWSVFQLVPTGRATQADLLNGPELEDLFERLYAFSRRVPFQVKTTEGQHYRRVAWQHWQKQPAESGAASPSLANTNDGKGFVFVSHTGEIFPSGFLPIAAGNVRSAELLDVYRDSPLFRALRDPAALKGKCGLCEWNRLCGGSRARAFAMTGDYLAEEPLCIHQPRGIPASRLISQTPETDSASAQAQFIYAATQEVPAPL
jgi:radical SAM protein with 4Fe4S-binding SPASM domain